MTIVDQLREIADLLDGTGAHALTATVTQLPASHATEATVQLVTCDGYRAACKALKLDPGQGQLTGGLRYPHRSHEALTKNRQLLVTHVCFPHLDCWKEAGQ